jgi:hypothetical protein
VRPGLAAALAMAVGTIVAVFMPTEDTSVTVFLASLIVASLLYLILDRRG